MHMPVGTTMPAHQPTLNMPLDLMGEVFEHLSSDAVPIKKPVLELRERRIALVNTAMACRAFQKPALAVLWRDMNLTKACCAPLTDSAAFTTFKGYREDEEPGEERENEDWPEGVDPKHTLYSYSYIDGPITPEQWARFAYYAQLIRTLRYSVRENVSPSVFFFLQQHSHGKPLFPNLRVVVWAHAVPEILSILSPTIRVLRFPFTNEAMENYGWPIDRGYRLLRHTFKTLLPVILRRLPELRDLDLRPLRHGNFWYGLAPEPDLCFVAQSVRTLHITEPLPTLLKGALAVISTIDGLEELRIVTNLPIEQPGATRAEIMALEWPGKESMHPFASLRSLHIRTGVQEMALLMDTVVAPNLEDALLHCMVYPPGRLAEGEFTAPDEVDALHNVVSTLCNRCAGSLQTVKLRLSSFNLPERRSVSATETESSFEALLKPLLQLHRLQDLLVDMWFVQNAPVVLPLSDMFAAWPMLRSLNVVVLSVSPGDLRTAARICPGLKSIRVMRLSDDFLGLPDAAAKLTSEHPTALHPLREIRLYSPSKVTSPANVTKIARFLCGLFPQLRAEECIEGKHAKNRYFNQGRWHEILHQVAEIQKD